MESLSLICALGVLVISPVNGDPLAPVFQRVWYKNLMRGGSVQFIEDAASKSFCEALQLLCLEHLQLFTKHSTKTEDACQSNTHSAENGQWPIETALWILWGSCLGPCIEVIAPLVVHVRLLVESLHSQLFLSALLLSALLLQLLIRPQSTHTAEGRIGSDPSEGHDVHPPRFIDGINIKVEDFHLGDSPAIEGMSHDG